MGKLGGCLEEVSNQMTIVIFLLLLIAMRLMFPSVGEIRVAIACLCAALAIQLVAILRRRIRKDKWQEK